MLYTYDGVKTSFYLPRKWSRAVTSKTSGAMFCNTSSATSGVNYWKNEISGVTGVVTEVPKS